MCRSLLLRWRRPEPRRSDRHTARELALALSRCAYCRRRYSRILRHPDLVHLMPPRHGLAPAHKLLHPVERLGPHVAGADHFEGLLDRDKPLRIPLLHHALPFRVAHMLRLWQYAPVERKVGRVDLRHRRWGTRVLHGTLSRSELLLAWLTLTLHAVRHTRSAGRSWCRAGRWSTLSRRRVEDVHCAPELLLLLLREVLERHRHGRGGHRAHMARMIDLVGVSRLARLARLSRLTLWRTHTARLQLPRRQHRLYVLGMLLHRVHGSLTTLLWRRRKPALELRGGRSLM